MVAAHIANALCVTGLKLPSLVDLTVPAAELRQSLLGLPRPVVAILYVMPALDAGLFGGSCSPAEGRDLRLIAVLNGAPVGELGVRLDVERATASLAAFICANRDTVLPIVQTDSDNPCR